MKGTVKWFSQEKGYGFIVGEDEIERYFNVRAINGAALPCNGAEVSFTPGQGNKGPRAGDVQIIKQAARDVNDSRVTCHGCQKMMVPRIITRQGSLRRSVCPFCGTTIKKFPQYSAWVAAFIIIMVVWWLFSLAR